MDKVKAKIPVVKELPITLAVVLRALKKAGKVGRIDTSNFYSDDAEWVMKLIIYWNLEHDNYDQQSEECKQFIGSLLGLTNHTTMKHHNCNCDILDKPSYHASDDPHSVGNKWICPEKQTCKFHPNGCINDGIHAEVPKQNIAATQQGDESVKVFTYEGSAFEAPTDEGWKDKLMDEFAVTFERAQDDTVVDRLESFIASLLKRKERDIMKRYGFKEDRE